MTTTSAARPLANLGAERFISVERARSDRAPQAFCSESPSQHRNRRRPRAEAPGSPGVARAHSPQCSPEPPRRASRVARRLRCVDWPPSRKPTRPRPPQTVGGLPPGTARHIRFSCLEAAGMERVGSVSSRAVWNRRCLEARDPHGPSETTWSQSRGARSRRSRTWELNSSWPSECARPLQSVTSLVGQLVAHFFAGVAGNWASAPIVRITSSWRVGYFAFTFCCTSAEVFELATAASNTSR
jgi:hypothetical protein